MLSIRRQSSQFELTSAVVSPGAMLADRFLPNAERGLTEVGFAAIDCRRCGAMSCSPSIVVVCVAVVVRSIEAIRWLFVARGGT